MTATPDHPGAGAILALDSSAALCAAALVMGGRVTASAREEMSRGQAERLIPLAQEVMAEAGAAPAQLEAVAVCTGPGNFTGVRIAVAAARGLALSCAIPAIGIPRPEALAHEALSPGDLGAALALVPTRRGELHAALCVPGAPWPRRLAEATGPASDILSLLHAALSAAPGPLAIRGEEAAALAAACPAAWGATADPEASPRPETLALLAAARLRAGDPGPRPAPVYLRPADAAPSAERPPAILSASSDG